MKIFLTEMKKNGKKYAGPNIIAPNLLEAEEAAEANGLIVVGEFTDIYVESGLLNLLCVKIFLIGLKLVAKAESRVNGVHVRHRCWLNNIKPKVVAINNNGISWNFYFSNTFCNWLSNWQTSRY